MRRARIVAVLALVVAASAAAASERFVPREPGFVVANVARVVPDPELRALIAAWQASPREEARVVALAEAYLARARARREPTFVGRAEALLAPSISPGHGSATVRRLYAEALQYHHAFAAAESLLDDVLARDVRDGAARSQRASIRLVRGDFQGARADCARLVAGGDAAAAIGLACLAEALAGGGDLARGRALLATMPARLGAGPAGVDPAVQAYLLTVRGELHERAGDFSAAIADYRAAFELTPESDAVRAALVDALLSSGARAAARAAAALERPSVAILVRQSLAAEGAERERLRASASSVIALERARGDAAHEREAALLALDAGHVDAALEAALRNFALQRELPDVRVLARAAARAHDAAALRTLRDWLATTRFADATTAGILAAADGR